MAELVNILRSDVISEAETASRLPADAVYTFDSAANGQRLPRACPVQKTRTREVVSVQYCSFQAREVVRARNTPRDSEEQITPVGSGLDSIVPRGQRYAYDLIAEVGRRTFLDGWRLDQLQQQLPCSTNGKPMPKSSIYDAQKKFLFYFGELHRQTAARQQEHIHSSGPITWLIDGTLEPGTPCFFGIRDAREGFLLGSWKLPTENENDVARCLDECRELYGKPDRIVLDLSEVLSRACKTALPDVPQRLCHYHFARDVGEDLYEEAQRMLSRRLRKLNLKVQLRDQRSGQTQRLRKSVDNGSAKLILAELLEGTESLSEPPPTLGSELLLGLHSWMLDYARDGRRQGFPFDPYLLYFHRRVVQVHCALKEFFSCQTLWQRPPQVLVNFADKLHEYLQDKTITEASELYEKAFNIFERLRSVLGLTPCGPTAPMAEGYALEPHQHQIIGTSLIELRKEFENALSAGSPDKQVRLYQVANAHLDKYGSRLVDSQQRHGEPICAARTTTDLERYWWNSKRVRRQTNGRKKLTRDFTALPAELMLVPNLRNPSYVKTVLGDLENLPGKLAEAGCKAGPFSHWDGLNKPASIGRLPRRLLRKEDFIHNLIDVCVQ